MNFRKYFLCTLGVGIFWPYSLMGMHPDINQTDSCIPEPHNNTKSENNTFPTIIHKGSVPILPLFITTTTLAKKKKFFCMAPDCPKIFKTRKERFNHFARIHSSEKPFVCDQDGCNKRYSTNASLSLHHTRCHTEKAFLCSNNACKKRYSLQGDLNQHLKRGHINGRYKKR